MIEQNIDLDFQDESNNTVLHYAVGISNLEIIELLMKKDADPYLYNSDNKTAEMLTMSQVESPEMKEIIENNLNLFGY